MNLPNLLSILRLLLVPLFVCVYMTAEERGHFVMAAGILLLSGATDVLDGWIARRFNMVTQIGKVLDPAADKVTQIAVFICISLRAPGFLPLAVIFVIKEMLVAFGGLWILRKGQKVEGAEWYGKLATIVFYIVVFIVILSPDMDGRIRLALMLIVLLFMLFSLCMYIPRFFKYRRAVKEMREDI